MFMQGHPTTKVDSIGALWLRLKRVRSTSKVKKTYNLTTKLTN